MPKKFSGTNSKAVEARERKENAKAAKAEEANKVKEDESWEDDDKAASKRAMKKRAEESKRKAALERKALAAEQLQLEEASMVAKTPPKKLTQAELKEKKEEERRLKELEKAENEKEDPIPENLNRLMGDVDVAQTVEQAISALDIGEEVDHHPEKRMKAAWTAFEQARLTQVRQENPSLRLSQIRQMLRKEWQKSPLNPMNE